MVSAGTKMVLYGGFADRTRTVVMSDIWILDVTTWTWTQGTNAGASAARANHVCSYSNGQFIVWGGKGKDTVVTNNVTMIYNLNTQAWSTTFIPNPAVVTTTSTTTSRRSSGTSSSPSPTSSGASSANGSDTPGSKTNTGLIIGIVAAVAVIGALAGFIVYRRKKASPQPVEYDHSGNKYQPQPQLVSASNFVPMQVSLPNNCGPGLVPVRDGLSNPGPRITYQAVLAPINANHAWIEPVMNTSVGTRYQHGQYPPMPQEQDLQPSQPLPYQPYQPSHQAAAPNHP